MNKQTTPAQQTAAINGRMYGNVNESYPFFTDEIELTVLTSSSKTFNALLRGFDNYEIFPN